MVVKSEISSHEYEPAECVFYHNTLQAVQYVIWGAELLDVIAVKSDRRFVFVFSRDDHEKYIERWRNYET